MNFQNILVGLIILGAMLYAGNLVRHKLGAFKSKNGACAADCGCEGKAKKI